MVPDEGVIVIQEAFSVAVHVLSLERLVERTTVSGDGSVPPLVAEKVKALGLTCKAMMDSRRQEASRMSRQLCQVFLTSSVELALCAGHGLSYESF